TVRANLLFNGNRLRHADSRCAFSFGFRHCSNLARLGLSQRPDAIGFLERSLKLCLALVGLNSDVEFGLGELLLLAGPGFGFAKIALLYRGLLLPRIRFNLLL